MKIILLDNVEKLGSIGSIVVVKSGYARNFLIPQGKAVLATKQNVEIFEKKKTVLKSKLIKKQIVAQSSAEAINKLGCITIKARSSIQGKLFGSVGAQDIAKIITESVGFTVYKSQIRLPNHDLLKTEGMYSIKVHIYDNIFSNLNVRILAVSA